MRGHYLVVGAAWLVDGVVGGCAHNNCLRALSNTKPGRDVAGDCSAYLESTVTPSKSTITTTVSITSTIPALTLLTTTSDTRSDLDSTQTDEHLVGRDATSKTMPPYVSACRSSAAYSSACSCLGVFAGTTTAPAESTTVTKTVITTHALTTLRPSLGNVTVSANSTSGRWGNSTSTGFGLNNTSTSTIKITSLPVSVSEGPTTSESATSATSETFTSRSSSALPTSSSTGIASSTGMASNSSTSASASSSIAWNSSTSASVSFVTRPVNLTSTTSGWNTSTSLGSLNTTTTIPQNVTATMTSVITSVTAIHWFNETTTLMSATYNTTIPTSTSLFSNTTASLRYNTTTTLRQNTTSRWHSWSRPISTTRANITSSWWRNASSIPTSIANITSSRWINSTSTRLPINATTTRWANTTMRTNFTTTLWRNTSTRVTPTPTPTADLTCGETAPAFALQVTQPGGIFDNWFVHVVGDGLLFTSLRALASSFSIGRTGHLCAVGLLSSNGLPYLASIGTVDVGSAVWMLEQNALKHKPISDDYSPINCTVGSTLSCTANSTSQWVACGLQLDLSNGGSVPGNSLNCTSVGLTVIASGGGNGTTGSGTSNSTIRYGGTPMNIRRDGQRPGGYAASMTYLQTIS